MICYDYPNWVTMLMDISLYVWYITLFSIGYYLGKKKNGNRIRKKKKYFG
jgi:hypothetical protein